MQYYYSQTISSLVNLFHELPGIGIKSAEKIVNYLISSPPEKITNLIQCLSNLKDTIKLCKECNYYSEEEVCNICKSTNRNRNIICIVEEPKDVWFIEHIKIYNGLYYVLGGLISYVDNVFPENLKLNRLLERIKNENISEIIIALPPTLEGDGTTLYVSKEIRKVNSNIKITTLTKGVPFGLPLEYVSTASLRESFEGRKEVTFKAN